MDQLHVCVCVRVSEGIISKAMFCLNITSLSANDCQANKSHNSINTNNANGIIESKMGNKQRSQNR